MSDKPHPPTHNTSAYASDPIGYIIEHGAPPAKAGHAPQHAAPAHDGAKPHSLEANFDKAFGTQPHANAPAHSSDTKPHAGNERHIPNEAPDSHLAAQDAVQVKACFLGRASKIVCDEMRSIDFNEPLAPGAVAFNASKPKGHGGRS